MVIDNRRIQQLPAYDRNALAFATLTANVNGTSSQEGHNTDFRINGGRSAQAEYFIDGIPVTTGYQHNVPTSVPSMEAVGEFNVVTNGLSAEYGRLSGGAVVLVTRSGTNQFHGSGYEYFRNNVLNANDWNSNRYGVPIGVFHDNVFGGTIGGPVVVPTLRRPQQDVLLLQLRRHQAQRHNNATLASSYRARTPETSRRAWDDNAFRATMDRSPVRLRPTAIRCGCLSPAILFRRTVSILYPRSIWITTHCRTTRRCRGRVINPTSWEHRPIPPATTVGPAGSTKTGVPRNSATSHSRATTTNPPRPTGCRPSRRIPCRTQPPTPRRSTIPGRFHPR